MRRSFPLSNDSLHGQTCDRGSRLVGFSPFKEALGDFCEHPRTIVTGYNSSVYSPRLLDHFEHPRNSGDVANPDASVQLENPACGDVLKLTLRIVDRRIAEIRFLAKGCVPTIACASALTQLLRGSTLERAKQLKREEIVSEVGGLPGASIHASHLAMDALAAALKQIS